MDTRPGYSCWEKYQLLLGLLVNLFLGMYTQTDKHSKSVGVSGPPTMAAMDFVAFSPFFYMFAPPTLTLVATGKDPRRRQGEGLFPHLERRTMFA